MALSIPAFIAMALGQVAIGAAGANARQKLADQAASRQMVMGIAGKTFMENPGAYADAPDDFYTAIGIPRDKVGAVRQIATMHRDWQQQTRERAEALVRGTQGGGAPTPNFFPQMGEGSAPQPGQGATPAGAMTPAQQTIAQTAPQAAPEPIGTVTGVQGTRALTPALPPVAPAPAPVVPQAPPRGPGAAAATPQVSYTMDPTTGKITFHVAGSSAEARGREVKGTIMAQAEPGRVSPGQLWNVARQNGVIIDPKEMDQYGAQDWLMHREAYERALTGKSGIVTPEIAAEAARRYAAERGWVPTPDARALFPTQAEMNAKTLELWQRRGRDMDVNQFLAATTGLLKIIPDAQTIGLLHQQYRAQVERELLAQPVFASNRNALLFALRQRGVQLTPEEAQVAAAYAPIGQGIVEGYAKRGAQPPLAANLVPSDVGGPVTGPTIGARTGTAIAPGPSAAGTTQAIEAEEAARKAREAGQQAQSVAAGGEVGRQQTAPGKMVSDPADLAKYIDWRTGETPPPQTQGSIDKKVQSGEYGTLHTTPDIYKDYRTFKDVVAGYDKVVNREGGIYSLSSTKRIALRLAAAPYSVEAFGFRVLTDMPPLTVLRKVGLTDQQIEDMNTIVSNNRLAVAHLRSLGEKGQGVSSKLFEQGSQAFPNAWDDLASARAKIKALNAQIDIRLKNSVSTQGTPVTAPDGTQGFWNRSRGPIPPGFKEGWK